MGVTIKDVAKEAGVSVATVSRVVNGMPNVNEEMKAQVEKAIARLGYKPNQLAKGLKNNVTNTIGVVVTDISDPFIIGVTRAAEKILRPEGYSLLMASTDNDEKKERECIDMMDSKCVDGLIISPVSNDIATFLKAGMYPVAAFDRNTLSHIYDTVYVDKEKAMFSAVDYLLKRGHTNIAMISGEKKLSTNFDRYNGYLRAFFENDQVARKENLLFGTFSRAYGMKAFKQLVTRKEAPTAVISGSATLTEGILIQARKMGVRIPEDISLISFGALSLQDLIEPQITHSKEMQEEIGIHIGEMLLSRLRTPNLPVRLKVLESNIIEGDSVKTINL